MAYYVSVIDKKRSALLVGPFNRHGDALRMMSAAKRAADKVDPKSAWYAFGTCRVKSGPMPVGRLNEALGLPTDGSRIVLPDPPRLVVNRRFVSYGHGPAMKGWVRCNDEMCPCVDDERPQLWRYHRLEVAA